MKLTQYIPTFRDGQHDIYSESVDPSATSGFNTGDKWVNLSTGEWFQFNGSAWNSVVTASSSGDVTVSGNLTVNGIEFVDTQNPQSITGPGAIDITTPLTVITTTGADAFTLANGTDGQIKRIAMAGDGGDGTLTPATAFGFSTITFADVGDTATLVYISDSAGWGVVATGGLGGGPVVA